MQERIFLCFVVGFIKIKKRGSLDINELLTPVTAECSVVWLIRKLSTPNLLLITLLMTKLRFFTGNPTVIQINWLLTHI